MDSGTLLVRFLVRFFLVMALGYFLFPKVMLGGHLVDELDELQATKKYGLLCAVHTASLSLTLFLFTLLPEGLNELICYALLLVIFLSILYFNYTILGRFTGYKWPKRKP